MIPGGGYVLLVDCINRTDVKTVLVQMVLRGAAQVIPVGQGRFASQVDVVASSVACGVDEAGIDDPEECDMPIVVVHNNLPVFRESIALFIKGVRVF